MSADTLTRMLPPPVVDMRDASTWIPPGYEAIHCVPPPVAPAPLPSLAACVRYAVGDAAGLWCGWRSVRELARVARTARQWDAVASDLRRVCVWAAEAAARMAAGDELAAAAVLAHARGVTVETWLHDVRVDLAGERTVMAGMRALLEGAVADGETGE